jgi:hypothetical protein
MKESQNVYRKTIKLLQWVLPVWLYTDYLANHKPLAIFYHRYQLQIMFHYGSYARHREKRHNIVFLNKPWFSRPDVLFCQLFFNKFSFLLNNMTIRKSQCSERSIYKTVSRVKILISFIFFSSMVLLLYLPVFLLQLHQGFHSLLPGQFLLFLI